MTTTLFLLMALTAQVDAWPAFLGQGHTPVDPVSIPLEWASDKNIAWQADLPGKGQSSPVIWGDMVFVTSIEGSMKETCYVIALSLEDGRERWRYKSSSVVPVRATYTQSRSAPTPVVDADHVYAFFETGGLVCLTHAGEAVWERAITDDYGEFESTIGLASSPICVGGKVILLIDHEGPSYLLAVDAMTGETCWITERTSRSSYSSPSVVPVEGAPQIVCSSSGSVDGYSPETGEELWTFEEGIGGNRTGAALPIADGMFAIGASPGMHNEREEQARTTNFIMRVEKTGDTFVPTIVWRTTEVMPSFNSPLVHAGQAYWVNRSGVVYCFDAATGEANYIKRTNGVCWASPVGLGDRVYFFGKDGVTTVLAAGSEYLVLAENHLWESDAEGAALQRGRHGGHGAGHGADEAGTDGSGGGERSDVPTDSVRSSRLVGGTQPRAEGGPPEGLSESEELEAARFADPVQYGVAIVNGSLVIRTGARVYCIRETQAL